MKRIIKIIITFFLVALVFLYVFLISSNKLTVEPLLRDSTNISLLFVEHKGLSTPISSFNTVSKKADIDAITNIFQKYRLYRRINQQDSFYQHESNVKSVTVSFFEGKELKIKFTVYDDGVLIINEKYYGCGYLGSNNVTNIYNELLQYKAES